MVAKDFQILSNPAETTITNGTGWVENNPSFTTTESPCEALSLSLLASRIPSLSVVSQVIAR